jgi:hypothetical protein
MQVDLGENVLLRQQTRWGLRRKIRSGDFVGSNKEKGFLFVFCGFDV